MTAARARAWASLDSAGLGFTLAIPSSHGCGTLGGTLNFGEHTVCSYGAKHPRDPQARARLAISGRTPRQERQMTLNYRLGDSAC